MTLIHMLYRCQFKGCLVNIHKFLYNGVLVTKSIISTKINVKYIYHIYTQYNYNNIVYCQIDSRGYIC